MSYAILVTLRTERLEGGQLSFVDTLTGLVAWGPIPCFAKAARDKAGANSNPNCAPTLAYGDTPTGSYRVIGAKGPGASAEALKSYGPWARLMLTGVSGDAMAREVVSANTLRIHGGDVTDNPSRTNLNGLRVTNGCIRVYNWDMQSILQFIDDNGITYPFDMTVQESDAGVPVVLSIQDDGYVEADDDGP